jgi:hypothetical protein
MKKINIYKVFMIMVFSIVLIVPTAALSKTNVVTFNGTIEGALCAIEGEACPPEDLGVHLITEVNFVLRASDGKYFYLPNVSRSLKARYAGKEVQITGKAKGESIIVDTFKAKEGGNYKLVWSLEGQKRELMDYIQH